MWAYMLFGICVPLLLGMGAQAAPNLATEATPTADSSFSGYGPGVLTDGNWVVLGQETTFDTGSPDRLGNAGNTWVSADVAGVEHWARLNWQQPVTISQVTVWWVQPDWYPRAFRVEYLSDQNWVAASGPTTWFEATSQSSTIAFPPVTARALRVVQHPNGGPERGFLAAQEIAASHEPGAAPGASGARLLSAQEVAALTPAGLERNLARLHEEQPGASAARIWRNDTDSVEAPGLADGDTSLPLLLHPGDMPGVKWPLQHVLDGGAIYFAELPPPDATMTLQVYDGEKWGVLDTYVRVTRDGERRCLEFACEPVATIAVRFVLSESAWRVTEVEVNRYLPAGPHVWPERLVTGNQYERQLLASGEEPSYARLCTAALSMRPARALLGLKDTHPEVGVTWDGEVLSRWPVRFSFGEPAEALSKYRDTVNRRLIDGWRPGTVVTGRIGDLHVTESVFVSFADAARTQPALFMRLELENLSGVPLATQVRAAVAAEAAEWGLRNGRLTADGRVLLLTPPNGTGERGQVRVPVEVPAQQTVMLDFVQPFGQAPGPEAAAVLKSADFAAALATFRAYWDEILAPAAVMEVPEAQVNRMYRAILAQLFVNADGDVMPYGADPGVYSGNLYGVEEGYAMMALAQAGFGADAQRYMDGTYLTPEFLVKVDKYTKYADRHQQYRNGLQPHYAASAYRVSRDRAWIEQHLPLIRECAEWTIAQRRTTMALENGEKPLHWGLLPKWSYGGDISDLMCYPLYANFACWKGLVDTAWLLDELGDTETAARYRQEAADYRECIDRAVEGNFRPEHRPPFLPLQLYATEPVGDDYDQLFAGTILHLQALEPGGRQMRYITDFMEQDNRLFCLMPRFRRDAGAGGLDGLYGLGYLLTKLQQDHVPEFLLGFYAYMAFNLERDTFAARETNLIYASDLHVRSRYPVPDMSDPVPCSAAVALQYLRHMLVTEAPSLDGRPSGELRLLSGTPRAWFVEPKVISLDQAPTEYGPIGLRVESRAARGQIEAVLTPPTRDPWQRLVLRLRHPDGKPLQAVTVNGAAYREFDAARELITLHPGPAQFRVVAEY